jgi:acetyl-CoA carboxylase biotin carboxyl carrier protein
LELKQIKELMAAMARTGTKKLSIKKEGVELQLERGDVFESRSNEQYFELSEPPLFRHDNMRTNAALSKGSELSHALMAPISSPAPDEKEQANYQYITSPMVGTFYISPTPGDPTFVKVGDKIEKHTIVCIIEAMKVMNEVKAGITGTIIEILVEDGHPVEFGTKLFRIS